MAGIGIKANISLNSAKLKADIAEIQRQIASQEGLFKLSVDTGTITQLSELKTQLKEIINLAGRGINIKIDTKVIHEAEKAAKDAKRAIDSMDEGQSKVGTTQGLHGTYEESLKKANKLSHTFFADTEEEIKTTMRFLNDMGQAYTEVWTKNKESGQFELGAINDIEDFGKIKKEVDGIGKSFDVVKNKFNQTAGAWENTEVNLGISNSFKDVSAQIDIIKSKGDLVDAEDVERLKQLVLASNALVESKKQAKLVEEKVKTAEDSTQKRQNNITSNTTSGRFVTQAEIDKVNAMRVALADLKTPEDVKKGLANLNRELNDMEGRAKKAAGEMTNLGNQSHGLKKLSDAMAQIGLYFSAWRITSEIFQELKRGIGIVAELDNQIVQVGIDMNITASQSKSLVTQAQRIASETGVAIDSVIRVAGVYSNANETMESVMAKVKPSAILSGISGADASVVTDMFQGIIAQYKIAGDDIEGISYDISDSIIAVSKNLSKNFDDSVKDISDALLGAGSVMEMMGFTYKETMAIVGATMEVTRQSGSEMGGALKMIGARIGGAKNTGEDVSPDEVSNAAKAYHKLGIEIVGVDGSFKPMKDTLSELRFIWDDLTDVEKSNVAEMSAGNRRRNTFIAMMESMEKSTALTSIALNAQGETLLTNEKYMESSGAKMQNYKNAVDALWQNTLSSETLKGFVDMGTAVVRMADSVGGAKIILGLLASAFLMHNRTVNVAWVAEKLFKGALDTTSKGMFIMTEVTEGTSIALNKATIATMALKAALLIGVAVAATAVIYLLVKVADAANQTVEELKAISDVIAEDGKTAKDTANSIRTLVTEQTKLESAIKAGRLSNEEMVSSKERLNEIYKELAVTAPELINSYNKEGEALATNAIQGRAYVDVLDELAKAKAQEWLDTNSIGEGWIEQQNKKTSALKTEMAYMQKLKAEGTDSYLVGTGKMGSDGKELKYRVDVAERMKAITEEEKALNIYLLDVKKQMLEAGVSEVEVNRILSPLMYDVGKNAEEIAAELNAAAAAADALTRDAEELAKAFDLSVDKVKKYGDLVDEINDKDSKGVSSDSAEWIMENAPSLLQYLGDEKKLKQEILKLQEEEMVRGRQLFAEKMAHLTSAQLGEFNTLNEKTKNDAEFYKSTVLNNQSLIKTFNDMYGIDLRNYNSLAAAKNAVDIKFAISSVANYNALFDEIYHKYNNMIRQMTGNENYDNMTAEEARRMNQLAGFNAKNAGGTLGAISFTPVAYNGVTGTGGSGASSSGSAAQKYESEMSDGYNKNIALIEEYQRQLDLLDAKISKTTTLVSNLKEQGAYGAIVEAIKQENILYAEQQEKLKLLNKAQADLANSKDVIARWMNRKYSVDMSKVTNEDMDYYLDKLYPKIISGSESVVNARNTEREAFTLLWTDYMALNEEMLGISDELISAESELISLIKEKYALQFQLNDLWLAGYRKTVDEAINIAALFNDATTFDQKESNMSGTLGSLDLYRKKVEGLVSDLEHQLTLVKAGSTEWVTINDQIEVYKGTLQDTNVEILGMQQALKALRTEEYNASMTVMDKIVGALRQQYEDAKKAELDTLKSTLDAEVKLKTAEIKVLQDRLDALNDDTADKEAVLQGLRDEKAMWENDDSILAKAKVAELDALIKDKELELEKDRIQAEIDAANTSVDEKQEAYDEEVTDVEQHYTDLMTEQALYAEASRLFQSMSQDEILNMLLSYDEKYKGMGSVLGAAFAVGLLEEIGKGMDGFDALTNGLLGEAMIPWLEKLSSDYNYNDFKKKEDTNGKTSAYTDMALIRQRMMDALGGIDGLASGGLLGGMGTNYGNVSTTIGTATISMPVNFYTNGQLDVDRSLTTLEGMFKNVLVGSGVMLSLNK